MLLSVLFGDPVGLMWYCQCCSLIQWDSGSGQLCESFDVSIGLGITQHVDQTDCRRNGKNPPSAPDWFRKSPRFGISKLKCRIMGKLTTTTVTVEDAVDAAS